MGWIYKITNRINGKIYIGKTELYNPYDRWKQHLKDFKKPRSEKRPLYEAMNKYGTDNFDFEPIAEFNNGEELCDKEKEYINKYRTYVGFKDCNGYNATLGGDGKSYLNLDENEVIRFHLNNGRFIGVTAKHFQCDKGSIEKILLKNNIDWLCTNEVMKSKFMKIYGGLVQLDNSCTRIVRIFDSPQDVYLEHPDFKVSSLSDAYRTNHKTHRYKNFIWYRLNELPDEYKPLLDDYYKKYIDSDNLEIDDTMLELAI